MGSSNRIIICFLIITVAVLLGCSTKIRVYTKQSGVKYIKSEAWDWQRDSVGDIGWRAEIYKLIEHCYDFKGVEWDDVKESFGPANIQATSWVKVDKADYLDLYIYHLIPQRKTKTLFLYGWDLEIAVNPITKKIHHFKKLDLGP